MRIFDIFKLLIVFALLTFAPLAPSYAFDASKVIAGDAGSDEIFESFFSFRKAGKQKEAVSILQYAAENGNPAAQWKLGRMYQTGDGVQKDPIAAFRIFQKIAARYTEARPNSPEWQFSADALVALGNYYRTGIPNTKVIPDIKQAQVMYTTAAMVFRHPVAQFELGRMQLVNDRGFGMGKRGIRNLGLSYDKGHVGAEALLGFAVFEGRLIYRDAVRGLIMLGNALRRASSADLAWISQLHEEAYSLARPQERSAAIAALATSPVMQ